MITISLIAEIPEQSLDDYWGDYGAWYDEDLDKIFEDFKQADEEEKKDENVIDNNEFDDAGPGVLEDQTGVLEHKKENIDLGEKPASDEYVDDYQIEDNRSEVKDELFVKEEENYDPKEELLALPENDDLVEENDGSKEEPKALPENDDLVKSALNDFKVLQQALNKDELQEDVDIDKLSSDEKSEMDLNDSLPKEKSSEQNNEFNVPSLPREQENQGGEIDLAEEDFEDGVQSDVELQSNIQEIIDETRNILEEADNEGNDFEEKFKVDEPETLPPRKGGNEDTQSELGAEENDFVRNAPPSNVDLQSNIQDIIEETQKILEETNDEFAEPINEEPKNDDYSDIDAKDDDVMNMNENNEDKLDEDSVDKVYQDLNDDLNKLLETMNKLTQGNEDLGEIDEEQFAEPNSDYNERDAFENMEEVVDDDKEEKNADDAQDSEDILEYEEKYGRPYREGVVLSQRDDDDYEVIDDDNLSAIFENIQEADPLDTMYDTHEIKEEESPIQYGNDALVAESKNEEDSEVFLSDLDKIVPADGKLDSSSVEIEKQEDDTIAKSKEIDDTKPNNDLNEDVFDEAVKEIEKYDQEKTENKVEQAQETQEKKVMNVEDLSSGELEELTKQFVMFHDIDRNFESNSEAIHVKLNAYEPTIVTSPNYPSAYPTTEIVDFILDGEGSGIELNVTDLNINSAMGHYVLVKPGIFLLLLFFRSQNCYERRGTQ